MTKASHMTSSASKPKKNNLDYWRKNCFNCAYFRRVHILYNGKDDGSVRFQCTKTDEDVTPHKVDGCRKFEQGEPMSESVNVETKNKSDVSSTKSCGQSATDTTIYSCGSTEEEVSE